MNFLAHAREVLDAPEELAGTALPDWVRAAPGRVRLVTDRIPAESGLAAGVRRHLDDDARFHGSETFLRLSRDVSRAITELHPERKRVRAFFFGHIVVEMLLDAALMERHPDWLDRYYAALGRVDLQRISKQAAPWLDAPLPQLAGIAGRFRDSQFLYGYRTDDGLLARLAGTAARAGVPVPDGIGDVIPAAREQVKQHLGELLS